ncbi:MAG: ribulose bisphosphate carboxylase small subunit [Gammaproteobacteria bacterium]|jgi:ribulose-bisphosphate carboxylase small chain
MDAQTTSTDTTQPSAERRMYVQLGECLRKGCVVCIEHAPAVRPRYTRWEAWARPDCYDGDLNGLYSEIERCRQCHADHFIRLQVEDLGWHSRLSLVVHRPTTGALAPQA